MHLPPSRDRMKAVPVQVPPDLTRWPPFVLRYSCFASSAEGIVAIGAARSFELSPTELPPPLSLPKSQLGTWRFMPDAVVEGPFLLASFASREDP